MPKRLSERVIARLDSRSQRSNCYNKAVFIALQNEIEEAMQDGFSLKAIWETLYEEGRITFKYRAFLRHAHSCIKSSKNSSVKNNNSTGVAEPDTPKIKGRENLSGRRNESDSQEMQTFKFNPSRTIEEFT